MYFSAEMVYGIYVGLEKMIKNENNIKGFQIIHRHNRYQGIKGSKEMVGNSRAPPHGLVFQHLKA